MLFAFLQRPGICRGRENGGVMATNTDMTVVTVGILMVGVRVIIMRVGMTNRCFVFFSLIRRKCFGGARKCEDVTENEYCANQSGH